MKTTRLIVLGATIILLGCSGPNASFRKVPSGYYRVYGMVRQPGLIKCGGSEKTLMTVIKDAGGFTIQAYLPQIRVRYDGNTNYFDGNRVLSHESEDPLLPCGSTISVIDNWF